MSRPVARILLPLLLVFAAAGCERLDVGSPIAGELSRARHYADALPERLTRPTPADSAGVLALGYLERLRLGLGGPFRLIDYASHDPRLTALQQRTTAWALLARTLDGRGYQIDPAALDGLNAAGPPDSAGAARLAFLDRTIRQATDPRAGELALRLAYSLAATEHIVQPTAPALIANAAALLRDRELARSDATLLLRAARRTGVDPLALLSPWRLERRFAVERPLLQALPPAAEREALELVPRILAGIREGAATQAEGDSGRRAMPLLDSAAAASYAALAGHDGAPPQAPIIITLGEMRRRLVATAPDSARRARWRFVVRSTNEERLAAQLALLAYTSGGPDVAIARGALAAAVSLRPYAQEAVWLPGLPGPTERQLVTRFGLASVTFDGGVRQEWQPYYRRMLQTALTDLERIVPALTVRGLHVRFGGDELRGIALALHDPRNRTMYLPVATGAGTIAHEIAHDLDWQEARRRYAVYGDYATDRAVRERRSDLATSLEGLSAASLTGAQEAGASGASQRPTEVFARNMDWFVAAALARSGRMNGYLSAVQDASITGYGAVTPPDPQGEAARTLMRVLDDVAPPDAATREWFLSRFGPARALGASDLLREILAAPMPAPDSLGTGDVLVVPPALSHARDLVLTRLQANACRSTTSVDERRLLEARRRLVILTEEARLREALTARAVERAAAERGELAARELPAAGLAGAGVMPLPLLPAGALAELASESDAVARHTESLLDWHPRCPSRLAGVEVLK